MQVKPAGIRFGAHLAGGDLSAHLDTVLPLIRESGFDIEGWELRGTLNETGKGFPDSLPAGLRDATAVADDSTLLKLLMQSDTSARIRSRKSDPNPYCELAVERIATAHDSEADLVRFMQHAAQLCRHLMKSANAYWAELIPLAGGAICVPSVPLMGRNSHLVIATQAEVAAVYSSPDVFWASGWQEVEQHGERRLGMRGMDAVSGPEYLRQIIDQQWILARAAKPRETRYALPQAKPSEQAIFRSGASRLELVGYVDKEQVVEYSCVLGAGQHIPGWEIFALWDLVQERRLPDGRPVSAVRVVFLEASAAEREKRPLLDVGCKVYHYDIDGELREITE